MTTQDLVDLINLEADELLDTDEDNIPYINHAIDLLSFFLASLGDPEMITTTDVEDNDLVPDNFLDFVPHNGYPLYIDAGHFKLYSDDSVIHNVKYTLAKDHVSLLTDTIPFKDIYAGYMVLIASYLIKKKTYIPVEYCQQDKTFVTELMSAIKAAKGAS